MPLIIYSNWILKEDYDYHLQILMVHFLNRKISSCLVVSWLFWHRSMAWPLPHFSPIDLEPTLANRVAPDIPWLWCWWHETEYRADIGHVLQRVSNEEMIIEMQNMSFHYWLCYINSTSWNEEIRKSIQI